MDLRYPIGRADWNKTVEPAEIPELIAEIAAAPGLYREAVHGLDEAQLDTPYRPDGWTVRQTVHHVADSHMNAYIRLRLALTEENPAIRAYEEKAWAELADARTAPVEWSLQLIESMHVRWAALLKSMGKEDFARTFQHPQLGAVRLDRQLAVYAWHCRHHAAHITGLRDRNGWK
jgi:hypothetical protein